MISLKQKENWEKQHYKIIGTHSAVKTCGWTKSMIKKQRRMLQADFLRNNVKPVHADDDFNELR